MLVPAIGMRVLGGLGKFLEALEGGDIGLRRGVAGTRDVSFGGRKIWVEPQGNGQVRVAQICAWK